MASFTVIMFFFCVLLLSTQAVLAEDAYRFLTWNVNYVTIGLLGAPKRVIAVNGQFPGPEISAVTNDILVINLFNHLDEPLLMSWNGVWQRRSSWQDGVTGTNCPIPPGGNFTYLFQVKDQIGSYFYFPSTGLLKAAGGYGSLKVNNRVVIPLPFAAPFGEYSLLVGDWFTADHKVLRGSLDAGHSLGLPNGILINGRGPLGTVLTLDPGKTYRLRISNVGMATSLNVRIQGHNMVLVETEGSHTVQNLYENLDIHVGQSLSVLVTMNAAPRDYYLVVSSRFTNPVLTGTAVIHYSNSNLKPSGPLPVGPTIDIASSLNQARTIRLNLTANAARPNPQGSFHYGLITVGRTIVLASGSAPINNKLRYTVNGISYLAPDTPLKLADFFNIGGVFSLGSMPDSPSSSPPRLSAPVLSANYHDFIEVVFQNNENIVQSWHVDGYNFFVVGMDGGKWVPASRKQYNLLDAISRSTIQVYPQSWTAILLVLDNSGMWNIRSQIWERQYLGQQMYLRVADPSRNPLVETPIPPNVLLCGRATRSH